MHPIQASPPPQQLIPTPGLPAILAVTLAAILTALAITLPSPAQASSGLGKSTWIAPLEGPIRVSGDFDPPAKPWLAGHRGVDLVASAGTVVRAAGSGSVTFVGTVAGRPVVTISHGAQRTTYEPVVAEVSIGQTVVVGARLGVTGTGGHCSGRCLHWGLIKAENYLDPLSLLNSRPPILKPIGRDLGGARTPVAQRITTPLSVGRVARTRPEERDPQLESRERHQPGQAMTPTSAIIGAAGVATAVAAVGLGRRRRSQGRKSLRGVR